MIFLYFKALGSDENVKLGPEFGGKTPMHAAAKQGHIPALRYLLDLGLDINTEDSDGITPVMEAEKAGKEAAKQMLVDNGAQI